MLSFGLIGAAGFVAPRHMQAIKAIGGEIKVAFDPNDSVGVIDRHFPDASFFVEFERFDRHVDKLRRRGEKLDWISICSPNYLHDAHCRFALRSEASAICEKPLVLNPWNLDGLESLQASTGQRVFTVLQLRLHPVIAAMRAALAANPDRPLFIDLTYIASRGPWYHVSWKGNEEMSGGVASNIGVHFFDALIHVFGRPSTSIIHLRDRSRAAGLLICGRAAIRWFMSIDRHDLPEAAGGKSTFRSIIIDNKEIDFTDGFTDLHVRSYEEILAGHGFGLDEARPAVELISSLRSAQIEPHRGELHPLAQNHIANLPRIPRPASAHPASNGASLPTSGHANSVPASHVQSVA